MAEICNVFLAAGTLGAGHLKLKRFWLLDETAVVVYDKAEMNKRHQSGGNAI